MKRIMLIILLLFSGCLLQEDVPDIRITIEHPPEELIVSETFDLSVSLTNEGDASALDVTLESNIPALLTFEEETIDQIKEGSTKKVKATIEALDILKEERNFDSIDTVIKAKYFDKEGNQKIAKTSFKFTVRKPEVNIDKVEAGLLPGKITASEHEKVPITVYVVNEEDRKMENLYIVFCTEYEHVTIYRLDIEEVGNCFEYAIADVLWFHDLLAKGFTMEAELPVGARKVSFMLQIKLVWRHNEYEVILDTEDLRVEVGA
ncbi:MAG: hypothetical protein AYK18_09940 [Theionarchaea archaeon DG-70]|nr:MAG: hypothetical protein AYK18_09940 [Theionarchaea archaeon DG-70]